MNVTVIVPLGPLDEHRTKAWRWIRDRFADRHPDWPVLEAVDPDPSRTWSKGRALATCLVADGIVVVCDADTFIPAPALVHAVELVDQGAPWVVPHQLVWRLDDRTTRDVLAGPPIDDLAVKRNRLTRRAYSGTPGGGIVVLPASTYRDIPIDPRFEGWGGEDQAWGVALDTLAGPHERGDADLLHLWHSPQPNHRQPLPDTEKLARRYADATHRPDDMRALVEEVTHARHAC